MLVLHRTGSGDTEFDTNDWTVPGGTNTGTKAVAAFDSIINQASSLNTGFIVLEHDLFQQEVDLSVGYFVPAALAHQPAFTVCSPSDLHRCTECLADVSVALFS